MMSWNTVYKVVALTFVLWAFIASVRWVFLVGIPG